MMLKRSDDMTQFQSTLSVRRATRATAIHGELKLISIHALREESDTGQRAQFATDYISIHALREESDTD